jgi:hypothetical protein
VNRVSRCLALALALPLGALRAQDTKTLAPGTRVRVWTRFNCELRGPSCPHWVVGTLASIDSLSIVLHDESGEVVRLAQTPNTRLQVSTHSGPCFGGSCAGVGLVAGAVAGTLVAWRKCSSDCENAYFSLTPAGALLGTIVGALIGDEHWERVEPPMRVGFRADGHGRVALGMSMRL